ncbi:MAG: FAD-dependent monooxygenase [Chloroflexi bacterium]|nr:FAD-dependent monooxygenase [Chloroflexota bacterium]
MAERVAIIGAGLGGLCLAHGLKQAGLSAAIYERDPSPDARAQGYRISLDARGVEALRSCLSLELFELLEATSGQPSSGVTTYRVDGATLKDEHTDHFPDSPRPGLPATGRAVDRLTLREILLAGLDDVVSFGKELIALEVRGDAVQAHFANGETVSCDVLVAADGVGSRVREQCLPSAVLVDTGLRWLGGRTTLNPTLRSILPASMQDRAAWVSDRQQRWFLAPVFFRQTPAEAAARCSPAPRFTGSEDFVMWALTGHTRAFPYPDEQLLGASEPALRRMSLEAVDGCHELLRELVRGADPGRGFSLAIRAVTTVEHWPSSRVTFLGDAIHASPVNGTGANAALEDAALLCWHLTGKLPIQDALDAYEIDLLARINAMQVGLSQVRSRWRA